VFKGNVTDKSIKTHAKRANLNVHRCIMKKTIKYKMQGSRITKINLINRKTKFVFTPINQLIYR